MSELLEAAQQRMERAAELMLKDLGLVLELRVLGSRRFEFYSA